MQSTPGKTAELYAGVKSLYDDFQALHISQTDNIHWVVSFHALPIQHTLDFAVDLVLTWEGL